MQITESVRMALGSIRSNKLRAGLTLLSIAIGIFAVVGAESAVGALNSKVDDQLASLGNSSFFVQKQPPMSFGSSRRKYMNRKPITLRQANEFKRRMTDAELVGLNNFTMGVTAKANGLSTDPAVTVYGTDETFMVNNGFTLAEGRAVGEGDVQQAEDVAVIGSELAQSLFKNGPVIGQQIRFNGIPFTIIGLLSPKGAVFGQSQDNIAVIPITSSAKYFFDEWGTSINITVRAPSLAELDNSMGQATGIMRALRGVDLGKENDFEVISNASISDTFSGFTQYIGIFGLGCGLFALAAAGFGVMNIMLVSVKERTREIGVRKAIGATRGNILSQFLLEAITLCQLGGAIGIGLGLLAGLGVGALMGTSPPVPWLWLGIAVATCTVIGLVFGGYPAYKAAQMDPIDALRYE